MKVLKELKVTFDKPKGFWARLFPARWMGVRIELIDMNGYKIFPLFWRDMSTGDSVRWDFGNEGCAVGKEEEEID